MNQGEGFYYMYITAGIVAIILAIVALANKKSFPEERRKK